MAFSRPPLSSGRWARIAPKDTLRGATQRISSPEKLSLTTETVDRKVRPWDSRTGASHGTHVGHSEGVNAVAFSPDGQLLASASVDHTVRLWDLGTGVSLGTLEGYSEVVNAFAFLPMELPEAPTPSEGEAARQESNQAVETKSAPKEPGQSGSVTLNWEQPPDSIPETDVTSELRKEADTNHPIGSATRGDSKQGLSKVMPEETSSLAANLASNISPLKSGSFEPMRRRGMSEPLENPFTRLGQIESWIRDANAQGGGDYSNALQAASYNGHGAVVRFLVDRGAEVNAQGGLFGNALQAASYNGHEAVVRFLIDQGAEVNAQGGLFGNALQAASYNGHGAVVWFLVDRGAEVNAQGGRYGNALQAASSNGHKAVVRFLVDRGAEVNAQGGQYDNALQAASYNGYEAVVRFLIDRGAEVDPVEVATIGGGTMSNRSPETQESSSSKIDTPLSGITSSQESTDSVDSDLLSVSESSEETESLESLDQNEADFPILREALDQLLQRFSAIKKTVNGHQPSSGKSSQALVPSAADSSTPGQSSKADLGRKHRRTEEDEEQDQADAALSWPVRKKLKPDTAQPQFLACPYWKWNSNKHRRCCKLTLKRVRDVKQHLHRRHTPEFYCERCFVVFPNDQSHQDHIINVLCRREPHAQLDGISHSQHRELCRKSNPAFTEENQWFAIWDILFPGSKRPFSAYIDSDLSADLCLFREHWQNSGQDVLLDVLRSNQWVSMSAEERETQGRRILTEGLNRIYEDWLSSRSSVTTEPQSAAPLASSSSVIARAGNTRSPSSETLARSVASVQLGPPTQASGAEMLENDPNDVLDPEGEETALPGSGELESIGLTTSNGVEVADLPGSPQEINMDEFLVLEWEGEPGVMDPGDVFGLGE